MNFLSLPVDSDTDLGSDVWRSAVSLESSAADIPLICPIRAVGLGLAAEPAELCALVNISPS